jgi:hypothetical protein
MVVEIRVADGHPLGRVDDVDEAVVVVLVVVEVAGEITRVYPDVGGFLYRHHIAVLCEDLGALDVPDDDVGLPQDREAYAGKT